MSNQLSCKKFVLEIEEGGRFRVCADGTDIPNIKSYNISNDCEENDITIDLFQSDADGVLKVINVLIKL